MLRSRTWLPLGLCVLAALGACGDSDSGGGAAGVNFVPLAPGGTVAAGTGGVGGMAGTTAGTMASGGTGGTMATGGTSAVSGGTGVTGGTGSVEEQYTCKDPPPEAGGTATDGMACCGGLGVCSSTATGPGSEAYGLDDCMANAGLKCVPATAPADGGTGMDAAVGVIPATCRVSLSGGAGSGDGGTDAGPTDAGTADTSEGRCIPACFVSSDPSSASLDQGSCATAELCVPCYSPISGESTGACEQSGDAPVEPPPEAFTECGGDADAGLANGGYCVPGAAASGMGGGVTLEQFNCAGGEVCAPKFVVENPSACFPRCASIAMLPGACIATFLVGAENIALLPVDTCDPGSICAPCISPLSGMRTGACDAR